MTRFVAAVIAFAGISAGLLYVAGEAGAAGIVIVAAAQLVAILAIARASTRA
ncbi:MAG: hypothetical protein ACJ735_06885 [Actinomycetes bacterium]